MKLSKARRIFTAHAKEKGFTLVEIATVIAVIGILLALVLRSTSIIGKSKGFVEGQNIFDTVSAVQGCFRTTGDFTALGATAATGTTYVVANCPVEVANLPATMDKTSGTITNQFGGARTVARTNINGGSNNAISVADPMLPSDVCAEVVQGQWGSFNSITVTPSGGTAVTVKALIGDVYAPAASASCATATTATVTVVQAKH